MIAAYELAVVSLQNYLLRKESAIDETLIRLPFEANSHAVQHSKILYGVLGATSFEFCRAHLLHCESGCCNYNTEAGSSFDDNDGSAFAQQLPCDSCRFRCFAVEDFGNVSLVMKVRGGDPASLVERTKRIFAEAELQQMMHAIYPRNVAPCIGNYSTHCYFVRRTRQTNAQPWIAVKIAVFVKHFALNRSANVSRQASQARDDDDGEPTLPTVVAASAARFDALVQKVRISLAEYAVVMNHGTALPEADFAVDYLDVDFCKPHNVITSTDRLPLHAGEQDDDKEEQFVFIDFGDNVILAPIFYHRPTFSTLFTSVSRPTTVVK